MRQIYTIERPSQVEEGSWTRLQELYGDTNYVLGGAVSSVDAHLEAPEHFGKIRRVLQECEYDPTTDWVLNSGNVVMAMLLILAAADRARALGLDRINVLLWSVRYASARPVSLPVQELGAPWPG